MVLGAKHIDRILTQLSRESQNAAKLIPHELLEISSSRFPSRPCSAPLHGVQ
jgi:hypothetical protein